jgi:hypothetical protein
MAQRDTEDVTSVSPAPVHYPNILYCVATSTLLITRCVKREVTACARLVFLAVASNDYHQATVYEDAIAEGHRSEYPTD